MCIQYVVILAVVVFLVDALSAFIFRHQVREKTWPETDTQRSNSSAGLYVPYYTDKAALLYFPPHSHEQRPTTTTAGSRASGLNGPAKDNPPPPYHPDAIRMEDALLTCQPAGV